MKIISDESLDRQHNPGIIATNAAVQLCREKLRAESPGTVRLIVGFTTAASRNIRLRYDRTRLGHQKSCTDD